MYKGTVGSLSKKGHWSKLGFRIGAIYDVLPLPQDLHQGEEKILHQPDLLVVDQEQGAKELPAQGSRCQCGALRRCRKPTSFKLQCCVKSMIFIMSPKRIRPTVRLLTCAASSPVLPPHRCSLSELKLISQNMRLRVKLQMKRAANKTNYGTF